MKSPISLRHYLSLYFGLAAIIPAMAIASMVYFSMVPDTRERTKIQHQAMADAISGQISAYLEGGQRQIKALATQLENRGIQPGPELTALLDAQCGNGEFFETLFIFNTADAGIQAVGLPERRRPNRGDLIGLDLSGRTFIREIKETGQTFLSKTFLSMVSNRPAVALAAPLPKGFLIGEITLEKLSDFIRRLPAKSGFVTMVLDGEGIVVADPLKRHWGQTLDFNFAAPGAKDLKTGDTIHAFELDGEKMLGTLVEMDRVGWRVLVAQPARKVFAPLGKIISLLAWGMAATLALVLALSWLVAGRFASLFTSYADSAESIAQGNYELEWPRIKTRESVKMEQSLASMAEKISQREKDLRFTQFTFDKAAVGIHYISSDGRILNVNEHAAQMLGYTTEEMAQLSIFDINPHADADDLDFWWPKLVENRSNALETYHLKKDGFRIPVEIVANFLEYEGQQCAVCFIQDISERRQMEESLRDNYIHLKTIYNTLPVIIALLDKNGIFTMVEGKDLGTIGIKPEHLEGRSIFDLFKDNPIIVENAKRALKGESCEYVSSVMGNYYHTINTPVFDNNKQLQGVVRLSVNVTEKRKTENEIRHLRNYLANIIDSMPSVLVGVDSKGIVTQWNHQAEQVTGVSSENACSQPLNKVFPMLTHEMERIETAIRDHQVLRDLKVLRKDQEKIRYEDITIFPLVGNGVEGAVIRLDDVTDQVRMEEMMIQSEKMMSVGGLAAGMAHEINNPMAGMLQTAQVLAHRLKAGSNIPANLKAAEAIGITMESIELYMEERGIQKMINTICLSGQRVAEIVTNMLSFARKDDTAVSSHHLDKILDKTIELAATDYDLKKEYDFKQVKIVKEYGENLSAVPCQASKIQQVLLNILTNGAQAMQGAGTPNAGFIIRTYVDSVKNMACIEIQDNGPGMDEKTRKKIFDPFFTTKPKGVGTGLGLSVSYFIITENHKGKMTVESSPGAGAKFIIRLPLHMDYQY